MLITFLETHRVTEDGFATRVCEAGRTYDLADSCARDCIAHEWAFEPRMRSAHIQNILEGFSMEGINAYAILPVEN